MDVSKTPRRWLVTDDRLGAALWPALDRLAPGDGVRFRPDAHADHASLAARLAERVRARGLVLAVDRDVALARALGADIVHEPDGDAAGLLVSRAVHDEAEARAAQAAAMVFVSPLFATRSHPGAPALGVARARALAAMVSGRAIALGGMDAARFATLGGVFWGWAGIDAFADR